MNWLKDLGVLALVFISPVKGMLIAIGVLVLFDTITGLIRAKKTKENINSNNFGRVVLKLTIFNIGILTGHILDTVFPIGIPFTNLIGTAIAMREGKSIVENIESVTGIDIMSSVMDRFNPKKDSKK